MRTALDTNVLSAVWDQEDSSSRLIEVLRDARREGSVVLCAAVYAETLAHPSMSESAIRQFLVETEIVIDFDLEEHVWVEAGRRYGQYAERRRRSTHEQPRRILADYVIGSHAMLMADRLITLDPRRYRSDFPELRLA